MSPMIRNRTAFAEILSRNAWMDINQIFLACKEANVFGTDFFERAIEKAMKAQIRRMIRSGKVKDVEGNVIRMASVVITDQGGYRRKVYKQEALFDVGDCVQVVRYWKDKIDTDRAKLVYYINLAIELHGPQIQGLLPLSDNPEE